MEHNPLTQHPGPPPQENAPIRQPPLVADLRLLRPIGEGSYGEVWLASNVIGTYRAVKVVHRASFDDDRPFEREFRAIQNFEPISRRHEAVVAVLQVGYQEAAGYFYYVMELADDCVAGQTIHPETYTAQTLSSVAAEGPLSLERCLEIGIALASGLQHLHSNGLRHRDIKPSNIIFVEGRPKLADIGLVAEASDARSFVGTTGFIPPEGPGSPQADIYSLGKVLYEISTGKNRHRFPELPAEWVTRPNHRGLIELNEIIIKACATEPQDRHASADDLKSELELLKAGKSVRRLRLLEQRWTRLVRAVVIVAVFIALAGAIGFQVSRERKKEAELRQRRVGTFVANGSHLVDSGEYLAALPLYVEALDLDRKNRERQENHRLRIGSILETAPRLLQMWFRTNAAHSIVFTPDGQGLLIADGPGAQIFDIRSGLPISSRITVQERIEAVCLDASGKFLALTSTNRAEVIELASGRPVFLRTYKDNAMSVQFNPRGDVLLVAAGDVAEVWDWARDEHLARLHPPGGNLLWAGFASDGTQIATCGTDGAARIWLWPEGRPSGAPLSHRSWVYHGAFSPNGELLATACFDRSARLWDVRSGQLKMDLRLKGPVRIVRFSPDGRFLAAATWDQKVHFWEAATGEEVPPILDHSAKLLDLVFHPTEPLVATAAQDGIVRLWQYETRPPPASWTRAVAGAEGNRYVTWTNDVFQSRATHDNSRLHPPIQVPGQIIGMALTPDENKLACLYQPAGGAPHLQLFATLTGQPLGGSLALPTNHAAWALSANASMLAMASPGQVSVIGLPDGQLLRSYPIANHNVTRFVFAPNHRTLLGSADESALLFQLNGDEPPLRILHSAPVQTMAFSPNGRLFATGARDNGLHQLSAQVWSADSGEPAGPPLLHDDGVCQVAFSPDGKRLVTASEDHYARVWDFRTGHLLLSPLKHEHQVFSARFAAGQRWIITACHDETVRIWDADTGDPLTPPLRTGEMLGDAWLSASGRQIITAHSETIDQLISGVVPLLQRHPLPSESRSREELRLLSELLSSFTADPTGAILPQNPAELERAWKRLRSRQGAGSKAPSPGPLVGSNP